MPLQFFHSRFITEAHSLGRIRVKERVEQVPQLQMGQFNGLHGLLEPDDVIPPGEGQDYRSQSEDVWCA